jgi:membrane associated rhomboid family serine protease
MIPLGDVIPVRVRPYVTFAAVAASVAGGGPLLHIGSSVMALALFGRTVEDRMGHGRFAVFVLLCGALAAVAQAAGSAEPVARGLIVSGAVAGVVGAYFALYPWSKVLVLVPVGFSPRIVELGAIVFCAVWYMLQVISWLPMDVPARATPAAGLVPSWGHLAGMALGAAGVWVFRRPERLRVEWWNDAPSR